VSHENGTPPEAAIDSHAEETPSEPPPPPAPAPGVALAPRPPAEREVLMPLDPEQVVEGMRQYQRLLRDLLEPSDWQTEDKDGRPLERPFLKKSGWRKIARAFNLSFERVRSEVERDEHGNPVRAEVWIRAVAPNGQYGDGDGYCSSDEKRFQSWRGKQKLENDLRTTATTRAKNRAIADLVGMGEVSAEEIEAEGEQRQPAGPPCDAELACTASRALVYLAGGNEAAERVWDELTELAGGQMPALGAQAVVLCARAVRGRQNGRAAVAAMAAPRGTERRAA
jgi:hypothetical protein